MSTTTDHPVKLGGVHHAAYRCKDAKETVEWYGKVLGMDYTTAFAEAAATPAADVAVVDGSVAMAMLVTGPSSATSQSMSC